MNEVPFGVSSNERTVVMPKILNIQQFKGLNEPKLTGLVIYERLIGKSNFVFYF